MQTLSGEPEVETKSASADRRRYSYAAYWSIVLLLPLFLLLAAFPIARSNYFLRTSRRLLWHAMAYHLDEAAGENCDVVLFGDSTGLTGLDPRVIQAQTGMKTCNLGLPYMAVSTTGNSLLDAYLRKNRPPKFIVFANHVSHLRPATLDETDGVIDGWWFVDRTFPPLRAAEYFLKHPRYTFLFAAEIWQRFTSLTETLRPDFSERVYRDDMNYLRQTHGFISNDYQDAPDVICEPSFHDPQYDPGYLADLQRYAGAHTRVMVYISPVVSCDGNVQLYRKLAAKLGIAPPAVFPEALFADDRHLRIEGAERNSEVLAHELLSLERKQGF